MAMEWTFGISDGEPSAWAQDPPTWDDETITATSNHSFRDFLTELCNTAVKNRREYDYEIDEHLWKLEIRSHKSAVDPEQGVPSCFRSMRGDEDDASEGSEDCWREGGPICIVPTSHLEYEKENESYNPEPTLILPCSMKLSQDLVAQGHVMELTYDYGTTTKLFLKALLVRPAVAESGLHYGRGLATDPTQDMSDMERVPAFALPKEAQLDAAYPNFSKAFLGGYVPVVVEKDDAICMAPSRAVGSAILGYSADFGSPMNTTFATMEDATCSSDLMFAPAPFDDINDFLAVAETSWTPKAAEDNEDLASYKYNGVSRWVLPLGPLGDPHYEKIKELGLEGNCFTKFIVYRPKAEDQNQNVSKEKLFDFAHAFPKTAAQLTNGKFRWISYKKGILRVLVGRGTGSHQRGFSSQQTLRKWNHSFSSLHELFCAVEASWIYEGNELEAGTHLEAFDASV